MIEAVRPWVSIDASWYIWLEDKWVKSDLTTYDSQSQIEFCMTCPFADECHNCLALRVGKRDGKRRARRR